MTRDRSSHSTAPRAQRHVAGVVLAALAGASLGQLQPVVGPDASLRFELAEARAQSSVNATLAVLVIPAQRKGADDAEGLERQLGEQLSRLDVVRPFDLSPIADSEQSAKLAELIEDSLRALLLRTPKRASERLARVDETLTNNAEAIDYRQYARLFKAKSLAALAASDLITARDWLVKSLLLAPQQTSAEYASYGSTARELFESARGAVDKLPKGDLRVSTRGARADIYVDGEWRGAGQVAATGLPAGNHLIAVRSPGMIAERRFVEVVAGKPTAIEFDLKPAPFGPDLENGRNILIANYKQPSVVEDRARELRNQLGADQLIIVRPNFQKKSVELDGWFLGQDGSFKKITANIERDDQYLDRLGEVIASASGSRLGPSAERQPIDLRQSVVVTSSSRRTSTDAYIDPNAPLFEDGKQREEPLTKKWWFWTAVAGGAALIGGGLYLLASGQAQEAQGATGSLSFKLNQTSGN